MIRAVSRAEKDAEVRPLSFQLTKPQGFPSLDAADDMARAVENVDDEGTSTRGIVMAYL